MSKTWAIAATIVFANLTLSVTALGAEQHKSQQQPQIVLGEWLKFETAQVKPRLMSNLLSNGAVLASPSQSDPDYYYHWTRDAALTMDTVAGLYEGTTDAGERSRYLAAMKNYAYFSRQLLNAPSLSGEQHNHYANLGEPKYFVNGAAFSRDWGRPQTDGPALCAITFLHFLEIAKKDAAQRPFDSDTIRVMKEALVANLDYTAYHWHDSGYDLWEEIKGQHFYNGMAQRRALLSGAEWMQQIGQRDTADFYFRQAAALTVQLQRFWDGNRGYLQATLERSGGLDYKSSNLDTAIVLAALHTDENQEFFGPGHDQVLVTAEKLRNIFGVIHPINQRTTDGGGISLAPGIGRYPEDRYDGNGTSEGHGWFLATAALAEVHYRAALHFAANGHIEINKTNAPFFRSLPKVEGESEVLQVADIEQGLTLRPSQAKFKATLRAMLLAGDQYLARIRHHASSSGSIAEQFDRHTGFMRGARDLTWSFASLITAADYRDQLLKTLDGADN